MHAAVGRCRGQRREADKGNETDGEIKPQYDFAHDRGQDGQARLEVGVDRAALPAADAAVYDPDAWYSGSGSDFEIITGGTIGAVLGGISSPSAGLAQMKTKLQVLADTKSPT